MARSRSTVLAQFLGRPAPAPQTRLDSVALGEVSDRMFELAERVAVVERELQRARVESTNRSAASESEFARLCAVHDSVLRSKSIRYSRPARLVYHRVRGRRS